MVFTWPVVFLITVFPSNILSGIIPAGNQQVPVENQQCQSSRDCSQHQAECVLGFCVSIYSFECPENMYYTECMNKCNKNCAELEHPNKCIERDYCIEGCECKEGFVWEKEKAVCVTLSDCNATITEGQLKKNSCPPLSTFNSCPSHCPTVTCDAVGINETTCNDLRCDSPRCTCLPGYVQLTMNIEDGCIPDYECISGPEEDQFLSVQESSGEEIIVEPVESVTFREISKNENCPLHSSFQHCVPVIPINCYTLKKINSVLQECATGRCECDSGYVKADSGELASCVPIESC